MLGKLMLKSRLKRLNPQAEQQSTSGGPKGFLGKLLNSSKLGTEQRNALMSTMDAGAPMRSGMQENTMTKGGKVKKMAKGGSTASKRADGCATKGKTKGRFV